MPSRQLNPTRSDQFCHCSRLPSRVNDGPSGWVISSGSSFPRVEALRMRSGTCWGTYSPITSGRSTEKVSSISSSSMVFMSMIGWNPLTGPA